MGSHEDIASVVIATIRGSLDHDGQDVELNEQTVLETLSLDSLEVIEILFQLESRLDVEADEEGLKDLETVADVVALFAKAKALT